MDFKELFIAEQERIAGELEEAGVEVNAAYDKAAGLAYDAARDRYADMADNLRQRMKYEGY
jgi:hypothetical protein